MPLLTLFPVLGRPPFHLLPEELLLVLQGLAQMPPSLEQFHLFITHSHQVSAASFSEELMLWYMAVSEVSA